jgi:hypothetical protein
MSAAWLFVAIYLLGFLTIGLSIRMSGGLVRVLTLLFSCMFLAARREG